MTEIILKAVIWIPCTPSLWRIVKSEIRVMHSTYFETSLLSHILKSKCQRMSKWLNPIKFSFIFLREPNRRKNSNTSCRPEIWELKTFTKTSIKKVKTPNVKSRRTPKIKAMSIFILFGSTFYFILFYFSFYLLFIYLFYQWAFFFCLFFFFENLLESILRKIRRYFGSVSTRVFLIDNVY